MEYNRPSGIKQNEARGNVLYVHESLSFSCIKCTNKSTGSNFECNCEACKGKSGCIALPESKRVPNVPVSKAFMHHGHFIELAYNRDVNAIQWAV